jgi:L-threonylcarbamoyladenylate synthase
VLDGGPTRVGIESTVVSIADGKITLLRPGMIALGEIEKAVTPAGSHPSPGMAARHYSPRTPLLLVHSPSEMPDRRGAYVWWNTSGLTARSVRLPNDPVGYAHRIYSVLHDLDEEKWPWIAVEAPPDTSNWAAIADRLKRAASK